MAPTAGVPASAVTAAHAKAVTNKGVASRVKERIKNCPISRSVVEGRASGAEAPGDSLPPETAAPL